LISEKLKENLFPIIPKIMEEFRPELDMNDGDELNWPLSPGAHIYDERGIRSTIRKMKKAFFGRYPGNNFFAVKACPNLTILKIIVSEGFGLDCASPTELFLAKKTGISPDRVMYTSNNTRPEFYEYALKFGCIMNLDDITFIEKLPYMPKLICFRYNPGDRRTEGTNSIIGNPVNQKYGLTYDQIVEAYRIAKNKGAERFGIHTMYASNCLDANILAGNAEMQLDMIGRIQEEVGIRFEFMNIGGGLGVNYKPEDKPLDIHLMGSLIDGYMDSFREKNGYAPLLYIESGRYITGPNGVLVTQVVNRMEKYKTFIGVDICDACDILRAGIYPAYHEISVITDCGGVGKEVGGADTPSFHGKQSIVGPLCENMHMVSDRRLPEIFEGDFIVIHDTGAHGAAMRMNYNGWTASQALLLRVNGDVIRIARAQTIGDLLAQEYLDVRVRD